MCLQFGYLTPEHVRDQLSQRQIDEWYEYYLRNPFGDLRADLRNGLNCVVTYKSAGGKKKLEANKFIIGGKRKQKKMTLAKWERDVAAFQELRKNGIKGNSSPVCSSGAQKQRVQSRSRRSQRER